MSALLLFEEPPKQKQFGHAAVGYKQVSGILTKATGRIASCHYSLNPYAGCSFGCTYCYAAFFMREQDKMDKWGQWVEVKENALVLLKKWRHKPLIHKTVFLSSVTDAYQPIERKLELTRSILQELADYHEVRLIVQTRSALVTRDIDLFKAIGNVQVNMTVTTDDEAVRKVFEPYCYANAKRLEAIAKVKEAGLAATITMSPLLPVKDPVSFAQMLKATGISRISASPFHKTKGQFVAGTRQAAMRILEQYDWSMERYSQVVQVLQQQLPNFKAYFAD